MTAPDRRRPRAAAVSRRGLFRHGAVVVAAPLLAACGGREQRSAVGLDIVGIITADLTRSLRFYRRLGLEVPTAVEGESFRLRMPDGHVFFWEIPAAINGFDPSWASPPPGDRRVVLEFGFERRDSMEATYATVVAAGAPSRLAPFDQGSAIRYAIVEDPDGNQVSLRYPAA